MRQEQNNHHFQTPRVTPVSMEAKLLERWMFAKAQAEATIDQADYNLGRISLIYSGQLMIDFEEETGGWRGGR